MHLLEPGLRHGNGGFLHFQSGLRVVERLAADELPREEVLIALMIGLRQAQAGLGLIEFGRLRRGIESDQQGALADGDAVAKIDRGDAAWRLRPQDDRLVGAQRTDCRRLDREFGGEDLGGFDRARKAAGRAAGRRRRLASTTRRRRQERAARLAKARVREVAKPDQAGSDDGQQHKAILPARHDDPNPPPQRASKGDSQRVSPGTGQAAECTEARANRKP